MVKLPYMAYMDPMGFILIRNVRFRIIGPKFGFFSNVRMTKALVSSDEKFIGEVTHQISSCKQ